MVGCGYDAGLARGFVGLGAGGEGVKGRDRGDRKVGASRARRGGPVIGVYLPRAYVPKPLSSTRFASWDRCTCARKVEKEEALAWR